MDTVTQPNSPKPDPTGHPAIDYAQIALGVHTVYSDAQALEEELNEALSALDKAQDERRTLDLQIEDQEMTLLIEERGKHPDHSEAAMTRHLKEVYFTDPNLKMLRMQRNGKAGECSGIELDIKYAEVRLRTAQARLVELGGYFQYLAASKTAETSAFIRQEFEAFQAAAARSAEKTN